MHAACAGGRWIAVVRDREKENNCSFRIMCRRIVETSLEILQILRMRMRLLLECNDDDDANNDDDGCVVATYYDAIAKSQTQRPK